MHSTAIFLLAFGLLATVAMARPGKRPWSGHHHENTGHQLIEGQHGRKWSTYRLPNEIRLPRVLTGKLGRPWSTFTAKKIFNGKYLVVSPALIFKLKEVDNDTDTSTTAMPTRPTRSTTEQPSIDETTTSSIDEESTTPESEEEETTTSTPSFFQKRSFSFEDDEQLLFPHD